MFDGQSLGRSPFIFTQSYPYKYGALTGKEIAVANNNGTNYAQRDVGITSRLDSVFGRSVKTVLFDDGGTQDVTEQPDAPSVLAILSAYTAARRAAGADYIVRLALPPSTIFTAPQQTIRNAMNAALKANPQQYGYDRFVDLMEVPELTDANNATYFYDGTHLSDAATTLVANKIKTTLGNSLFTV